MPVRLYQENERAFLFMEVEEKEAPEAVEVNESPEVAEATEQQAPEFESADDLMDAMFGKGKYAEGEEDLHEAEDSDTEEKEDLEVEDDVILGEKRAEELLDKSEKEGLTDEEAKELEEMGYVKEKEEDIIGAETKEEVKETEWEAPSYLDPLKDVYPDSSFESQEEVDDAIYSLIGDVKANNEANKNLEQAIQEDPEFADFIKAVVVDKKSVAEAASEAGIDFSDAIPEPGDEGYKEYIIAQEKRKESAKKQQEFKLKRDQNLQRSVVKVQRFFAENKISKDDAAKIGTELDNVYEGIYNGEVPEKLIQFIYDGMTAKEKIKTAETKGILKGRNEQIKTKWKRPKGDGMKKLEGTKTSIQSQPKVKYANDGIKDVMKFMERD